MEDGGRVRSESICLLCLKYSLEFEFNQSSFGLWQNGLGLFTLKCRKIGSVLTCLPLLIEKSDMEIIVYLRLLPCVLRASQYHSKW